MGVDLRACRAALVRLADEDMILDTAINELAALRGEIERLRAIEAAARNLLTLDVPDPVAKAIALAIIASGLRDLIHPTGA